MTKLHQDYALILFTSSPETPSRALQKKEEQIREESDLELNQIRFPKISSHSP